MSWAAGRLAITQSGRHGMGRPGQTAGVACPAGPAGPACTAGKAGTAGSPQRVPIISPSSGVKPIVVSIDRPPATAHMLLPAPAARQREGGGQDGCMSLLRRLASPPQPDHPEALLFCPDPPRVIVLASQSNPEALLWQPDPSRGIARAARSIQTHHPLKRVLDWANRSTPGRSASAHPGGTG